MNFCCCHGINLPTTSSTNCVKKSVNRNEVVKTNLKIKFIQKCHTTFYQIDNYIQKLWQMFCHKLLIFWLFLFAFNSFLLNVCNAQTFRKVHLGFPETWNGDKYSKLNCPAKNIPKFIGIFLFL